MVTELRMEYGTILTKEQLKWALLMVSKGGAYDVISPRVLGPLAQAGLISAITGRLTFSGSQILDVLST